MDSLGIETVSSRETLVAEIEAAFDGVARECGVTLHEAREIDNHSSQKKRAAARALDVDARWQDVPAADLLRYGGGSFSFLDDKGFRYYLPAYMICVLTHFGSSKIRSEDYFIYGLCPDLSSKGRRLERFSILTEDQSRAILHFLEFVAKENSFYHDDVTAAIADYWGQFEH
jgi:hypothetical protein